MSDKDTKLHTISVEVKVTKNRKKIVLVLFIGILLALVSLALYFTVFNKNNIPLPSGMSQQQTVEYVDNLNKQQYEKNFSRANTIKTVDELKNLNDSQQIELGLIKMRNLYDSKDFVNLLIFADYLSTKGGSVALDSLKYCYTVESDAVKKSDCLKRLNEEAINQGLIESGTKLPESYLNLEGEGQ